MSLPPGRDRTGRLTVCSTSAPALPLTRELAVPCLSAPASIELSSLAGSRSAYLSALSRRLRARSGMRSFAHTHGRTRTGNSIAILCMTDFVPRGPELYEREKCIKHHRFIMPNPDMYMYDARDPHPTPRSSSSNPLPLEYMYARARARARLMIITLEF